MPVRSRPGPAWARPYRFTPSQAQVRRPRKGSGLLPEIPAIALRLDRVGQVQHRKLIGGSAGGKPFLLHPVKDAAGDTGHPLVQAPVDAPLRPVIARARLYPFHVADSDPPGIDQDI